MTEEELMAAEEEYTNGPRPITLPTSPSIIEHSSPRSPPDIDYGAFGKTYSDVPTDGDSGTSNELLYQPSSPSFFGAGDWFINDDDELSRSKPARHNLAVEHTILVRKTLESCRNVIYSKSRYGYKELQMLSIANKLPGFVDRVCFYPAEPPKLQAPLMIDLGWRNPVIRDRYQLALLRAGRIVIPDLPGKARRHLKKIKGLVK